MAKTAAWTNKEKTFKICTKCDKDLNISFYYTTGFKVSGERKYNSWCKSCIAQKQSSYHQKTWGDEKLKFTSFKRTKSIKSYLQYLRSKAIQRSGLKDIISLECLENLWNKQNGKCALTGWDLTMDLGNGVVNTNCSLDRIDSSLGYVDGNVQLVCRIANISKSNMSMLDFLELCKSVNKLHYEKI